MSSSSSGYHEDVSKLSDTTLDLHRALVSLQEELEAVDWYRQRADACGDAELQRVLVHNMNEEIEHACMVISWLRRHHKVFAQQLAKYVLKDCDPTQLEESD